MKTIKTSELEGIALDYAVAMCEYPKLIYGETIGEHWASRQIVIPEFKEPDCYYAPSINWSQGGPIVEREDISFRKYHKPDSPEHGTYYAMICRDSGSMIRWHKKSSSQGPTPLIAAMRCYVASKLGDVVEVPAELTI